ncbi:phage holin family protein [Streptomyces europaeiscabiei]|uniref:Phage holin family protein n=1 Tax=Streptomyces europaeiscabiei TaxID=146819 RepID=A0AAJ2PNM0_9ACTN|nr:MULTISPECIES: phage holin family protein [Streptomyces]MDX2762786.1 phage holin family protein [Streptomyces europaeiscabiei]MDX2775656.1 phage holin family protein [Streptomyces europaeiscabiei]MDX3130524.1 phage holin family protein [Streptomyces europaeiscabiei]MDX3543765.1 phage holin family protein [Streptomyces europaeiscabiei]MDX3553398.1 phage holin family protein [Streptomyces europaeiscabiei]
MRSARSERPGPGEHDHHSVGELVGQATEQLSLLVRQEIALAKEELTEKGRRAGRGGGLLGAAGAVAYVGFMTLAAAAVGALSLVLDVWAAALIVMAVLFVIAAVLAAVGRAQLRQATPPRPEQALDSVKADMDEIKGRARR